MAMAESSVVDSYREVISNACSIFSLRRDLFLNWTAFKICYLAIMMTKFDWYRYLVEVGFIDNSNVSCNMCKSSMNLKKRK